MNAITFNYVRFVQSAAMSALAQGLGAVGTALFQHHLNRKDVEDSREYMSPKMQAARLIEGGFNPARSLSQGAILSNQGQDIAPTDISASMASVSGVANAALQQKVADAQVRNINADTDLKQTQAGLTEQQRIAESFRNQILPDMLNKQLQGQELDNILKQISQGLTESQKAKFDAEVVQINKNVEIMSEQLNIYKEELVKAKSEAEIARLRSLAEPQFITNELIKQGIDNNNARLMGGQIAATISNINKDTDLKDIQYQLNDIALSYADRIESAKATTAEHERSLAGYKQEQAYIDIQESRSGRPIANFLAPIGRITGTFGNVFKGITKTSF